MKYTVTVDGEIFEIEFGPEGRAWVNRRPYEVDLRDVGGQYSLLVDHRSYEVHVAEAAAGAEEDARSITVGGRPYRTILQRGHRFNGRVQEGSVAHGHAPRELQHFPSDIELRAPLPGLIVEMAVTEGVHVEEQDVVAVLESMKMNLELRSPREGVVSSLLVAPGKQVAQDEVLAIISPNGASRSGGGV